MAGDIVRILHGKVVEEEDDLTLDQICRRCRVGRADVVAMVDEGILEPDGERPAEWRFAGASIRHVRIAVRLQRDLGVNLPGAALALHLLDRLAALRRRTVDR